MALVECVPNFSEGRNKETIAAIAAPFRETPGVKLLHYSSDYDHNRMVLTAAGEPHALQEAVLAAAAVAVERIDLRKHQGGHPRMGAVDVVPFIPIEGIDMQGCVQLARQVGEALARKHNLPVYLYEQAASAPHRQNLAEIRKGQFEGFREKIKQEGWRPDFGPPEVHPSAGVTAVGARPFLIAYNINLSTPDKTIAEAIARRIRYLNGGLRHVKALGIYLEDRRQAQVSINLTDFTRTPLYQVQELVKVEARRYGVTVTGSEVVGLVPSRALLDAAAYYLQLEGFSLHQVLENRLKEEDNA